jgi:hypothetical protein
VEPEIQQILQIEKANKTGKLQINPRSNPSGTTNPTVGSHPHHSTVSGGVTTSTPAVNSKTIQQLRESNIGINNPSTSNSSNNAGNGKSHGGGMTGAALGDITASPILHPRQAGHSPSHSPKLPKKFDLNNYKYA